MRILILLALLASHAHADTYLTLGGWSAHIKDNYIDCPLWEKTELCYKYKKKYNSNHNAFIIDHNGFTVGTYLNSYSKQTYLAGYTYRLNNFSISAAYATGYRDFKNFSNS